MAKEKKSTIDKFVYWLAVGLAVYMPLHIFLSQSISTFTGGLSVWKGAKDVVVIGLGPLLLLLAYNRGLFKDKFFRNVMILGALYALLHLLFVVLSDTDDTYSAIVGSVYNTRLLVYFLIGYLVGAQANGKEKLQKILKIMLYVSLGVVLFGLLQYFVLPKDFLTHFGYSLERGVKYMFFIDDKPDLPRIMSTLRDPNSLGAYLLLPLSFAGILFLKPKLRQQWALQQGRVVALGTLTALALFVTFSRSAYIGAVMSAVTILYIVTGDRALAFVKKYLIFIGMGVIILSFLGYSLRDSYVVQNFIFHADEQTVLTDPNQLRVDLAKQVTTEITETPQGHGPGTAGIVSIKNPVEGILTENYYLQIAYEVGWLGVALFIAIMIMIAKKLWDNRKDSIATLLFALFVGYLPLSLLNHLWTNEAVALQWWLLCGVFISTVNKNKSKRV